MMPRTAQGMSVSCVPPGTPHSSKTTCRQRMGGEELSGRQGEPEDGRGGAQWQAGRAREALFPRTCRYSFPSGGSVGAQLLQQCHAGGVSGPEEGGARAAALTRRPAAGA